MSSLALPEVEVFPDQAFALAQPRGIVTADLIVTYARAMVYDPRWQPGFTEVWDGTMCGDIDITPSDMTRLQELEEETLSQLEGSRTILVFDRPLIRITVHLYSALIGKMGRKFVTARTTAEAAEMMGIDAIPILT